MSRESALSMVGEIAVSWQAVEKCVLDLLWLYVGTDRPTFEIILGPLRPTDKEKLLRDLVTAKEPIDDLRNDVLIALARVAILRENRNMTLHGLSDNPKGPEEWPIKNLQLVCDQLHALVPNLEGLCSLSTAMIMLRDEAPTPDGLESPPFDAAPIVYPKMEWPPKPSKVNPWKDS